MTEETERLLIKENCSQSAFEGIYEEVEQKAEEYRRNISRMDPETVKKLRKLKKLPRNMTDVKIHWKKLIDIGIVSSNLGDFRFTEHNISGPGSKTH